MQPYRIKTIRKTFGLSPDAFAALMGLTGKHRARTVFAWEKGQIKPSKDRETKMMEMEKNGYAI